MFNITRHCGRGTPSKREAAFKSGSISFAGSYSTSTNRLTNMSSSYDSNGNLTGISSDATYSYSWDAEGKPVSITRSGSTVNLADDALGRMVEQNRDGSYTQIVYGPGGTKLALMSGSSLQRAFVPLPAGAQAVYNGSGLAYYRHADWLGSSRLASTPSRTLYYDGAYAPYGESEQTTETGTTDHMFTGQNEDTHPGLYDFMYREYHPVSGRWSSPDPAGLAAVDLSNPQSLNRYAYVINDPANYFDPLGLQLPNPEEHQTPGGGGYCLSFPLNDESEGITGRLLICFGGGGNRGPTDTAAGGGPGGTIPNAANTAMAATPPSPRPDCGQLLQQLTNRSQDLQSRYFAIVMNPQGLPPSGPNSIGTHQDTFGQRQTNFQRQLNRYRNSGCGDPPQGFETWATLPAPNSVSQFEGRDFSKFVAGAGLAYIVYRVLRMVPSLAPPLWWTLVPNAVTP